MSQSEKAVVLQTLDHLWREHIIMVEHLRQVVHLRGYGQRDPLNEYKTEGFTLFEAMMSRLREMTTSQIMRVEIQQRPPDDMLPDEDELPAMEMHHFDASTGEDAGTLAALLAPPAGRQQGRDPKDPRSWGKVGRNEPCPCGSGKKYKHCHGAFA
jgi:preprotein translocase subunit SecA